MLVSAHCGEQNPAGARFCNACATALAAEGPKIRKTVSIVRCDLTGSTAMGERLDPEPLREIMTRYYDEMRAVIERHGGTVEKFIGDAVMGVFGIPVLHEDDALRAVLASAGMREALRQLNAQLGRERGVALQVRTAVMTGEVMASDAAPGQAFVIGDAANVVARLETSAQPGEILIGEPTMGLVAGGVDAEPVAPLTVKGKSEPLRAWRLLSVRADARLVARRADTPMVGRARELSDLLAVLDRAKAERSCRVVTILGEPGIGKSRLSDELARRVAGDTIVLRGRCLAYGEGITYWPLTEMLRSLAGSEKPAAISRLLEGMPDADLIGEKVATALGASQGGGPSEETFWAVRRLFERLARDRPLLVLIDDLQWAEQTFLELVEHVAYLSRSAPILVVGLARSEFLDIRPEWPGPRFHLDPLHGTDATTLLENLAPERDVGIQARARIMAAAGGNPLFIEQLTEMLKSEGPDASVPQTIHALLAARVDQLGAPQRRALESASVIGQQFWSSALQVLDEQTAAGRALVDLVRLGFIVPDESATFPEEDAFRFVHILVRDAAYAAIPKGKRSELHERFAAWIERHDERVGVQHEEIVGYHLEQAVRYLEELGPASEHSLRLSQDAGARLVSAARKAVSRDDMPAAANLFTRAVRLLPRHDPTRLRALPDLAEALVEIGELRKAQEILDQALHDADAAENVVAAAHARIERENVVLYTDPEGVVKRIPAITADAIRIFEKHGDDLGLSRAWQLRSQLGWMGCRFAQGGADLERAATHAERAGSPRAAELRRLHLVALSAGPTPVDEVLVHCEAMLAAAGDPIAESAALGETALMEAYRGNFVRAHELIARREPVVAELGLPFVIAVSKNLSAKVAMVTGDAETAERRWREACDMFIAMNERSLLSTRAAELAEKALYVQGKYDDAERFAELAHEAGASDDIETQARRRGAEGKLLARRGEFAAADRLVGEALSLIEPTDHAELRGDVLMDAAETFRLASRGEDAAEAARRAEATYSAKGMIATARQTAAFTAALAAGVEL